MADQVPEDMLVLYKKMLERHPAFELKGGKKLPYTSHNGHMFSMLSKDGRIGIRLGKAEREAFLEKYDAVPYKNYGAFIKDYVEVPAALLENLDELEPYLAMSWDYVQTLKPKPGKK